MLLLQRWIYIVKRGDYLKAWELENSDAWFLLRTTPAGSELTEPLSLDIIARQYPKETIEVGKNLVLNQYKTLKFPRTLKYGYPFKFHYYVNIGYQKVFTEDSNGQFGTHLVGIDRKNNLALYRICTGGDGRT